MKIDEISLYSKLIRFHLKNIKKVKDSKKGMQSLNEPMI